MQNQIISVYAKNGASNIPPPPPPPLSLPCRVLLIISPIPAARTFDCYFEVSFFKDVHFTALNHWINFNEMFSKNFNIATIFSLYYLKRKKKLANFIQYFIPFSAFFLKCNYNVYEKFSHKNNFQLFSNFFFFKLIEIILLKFI